MRACSNLVRDSKVARDLITLLRRRTRPVPLERAARATMGVEGLGEERLRHIFEQLLADDPRFELSDAGVRLAEDPRERRPLAELDFAVVDTETTGCAMRGGDRMTEVAAVRVRGGRTAERFSTLVNPGRTIPGWISQLTGITNAMVRDAPSFERAAPDLLEFLGDAVIVAHNAPFDRGVLDAELGRAYNRALLSPFLCTVRLARRFAPGLGSYGLDSVAAHFDVSIAGRHRALGDAEATAEVFCRLLERAGETSMRDLRPGAPRRSARASA